ncbi:hypothetical protein [Deefgea sp. CFH1-16]|uniref:hypothetical protein n=1 Tax=Deefgea sp. CFH1-16 TaxID=2675457 RepID=UPI0015F3E11B|nr:hypothetical protein [Deefgea sp. CFH1-16]MBM5573369.1 hypothetical protein [Deefgea sp. CFH1-16]
MPKKLFLSIILSVLFSSATSVALAHGDEDHGGGKPVVVSTAGLPSAETRSEEFELLAQLKGKTLQVYLDRYSDNAPIENAKIEVDSGAFKTQLKAITPGKYEAEAAAISGIGEHALVFTIVAGAQSDLLEATLKVGDAPVAKAEHAAASGTMWRWVGGGVAGIMAIAALLLSRQRRSSRKPSGAKA